MCLKWSSGVASSQHLLREVVQELPKDHELKLSVETPLPCGMLSSASPHTILVLVLGSKKGGKDGGKERGLCHRAGQLHRILLVLGWHLATRFALAVFNPSDFEVTLPGRARISVRFVRSWSHRQLAQWWFRWGKSIGPWRRDDTEHTLCAVRQVSFSLLVKWDRVPCDTMWIPFCEGENRAHGRGSMVRIPLGEW